MWRYPDDTYKQQPPAAVVLDGYRRNFADLTREQWDGLGYNEAVPVKRDPYTTYNTQWVKGDDLIYREDVVAATVDEDARTEDQATAARIERDRLLRATDWTQLTDSVLDAEAMVLWQSYRQALRDVPQQAGFPAIITWPEEPAME